MAAREWFETDTGEPKTHRDFIEMLRATGAPLGIRKMGRRGKGKAYRGTLAPKGPREKQARRVGIAVWAGVE